MVFINCKKKVIKIPQKPIQLPSGQYEVGIRFVKLKLKH